ncbi:hypothetical protein [Desulfallas thermosapovorans]|uniref:Methionine synthase II (Cobalamin-independent) n=1 Tax=Desulfallas thermosapovorans DSM 6562 TaxID=1121431 RepID=A0A5S4ZSK1_9FIRM|nr:hypothetical protein [Desulfallas thermosapovorans]TYO95926.1 hypothetical protein LX24_01316 [Desulfallas thermosapovorans DSM 6562]
MATTVEFSPRGLSAGIGSMPFKEAGPALQIIWENMPAIPHWPQLPRRGGDEGFVHQFLDPLVRIGLLEKRGDKTVFPVDNPRWPERLTQFYTTYLSAEAGDDKALEMFAFPRSAASGFYAFMEEIRAKGTRSARFLKGHLAGPLTIGFQLKDERGRLAYYEDQLRDVLVKTLAMHARWQAAELAKTGLKPIIFVDEPGVRVYGSSSYITVTREMVVSDLNAVFAGIHAAGGLAGVHSCDAVDWSLLYESNLEIVNLDVYQYGDSLFPYVKEMKKYLERGGVLAWGIVPTLDKAFDESASTLLARLEKLWAELGERGIERATLLRQSLITPACGTGLLEPDLSERIYVLTRGISEKVTEMAAGI